MTETGDYIPESSSARTLTQEKFADKIGTSLCHVGRVEAGVKMASIDLLVDIATIFNVTLDYLILGR